MDDGELKSRLAELRKSQAGLEVAKAFMTDEAFEQANQKIQREIDRLIHTQGGAYVEGNVQPGGDFVGRDQNKFDVHDNDIQVTVQSAPAGTDPAALRRSYLACLFDAAGVLQLSGIDPKAARESSANLSLSAVYTALLTLSTDEKIIGSKRAEPERVKSRQVSALEMLNHNAAWCWSATQAAARAPF